MSFDTDATRFDVRVVKYHIRRGMLTPDEFQAQLDSLPDDAADGTETTAEFTPNPPSRSGSASRDPQRSSSGRAATARAPKPSAPSAPSETPAGSRSRSGT